MTPVLRAGGHGRPTWGAEALWELLEPRLPGLTIEIVERIDSTNSELTERLRRAARGASAAEARGGRGGQDTRGGRGSRADDLAPQLLVATHQTAGRGRLGRSWHATPGASLTFSLALPLAREDWSGLSLAVGLAVAEAIDPAGHQVGLKWPNDILRRTPAAADGSPGPLGGKLGGILIESVAVGGRRVAVIGIGLNVLTQRVPVQDAKPAALTELEPELTAQALLSRLMPGLVTALERFEAEGFAPRVADYAARDVLRGLALRTTDPALPGGIGDGVEPDGALRLRESAAAGAPVHRVISGEISIRQQAAGA